MKKEALQEIRCRINDLAEKGTIYSVSIMGQAGSRYCSCTILNIDDVLDGISNYLIARSKDSYGVDNIYIDLDSIESVTVHQAR